MGIDLGHRPLSGAIHEPRSATSDVQAKLRLVSLPWAALLGEQRVLEKVMAQR